MSFRKLRPSYGDHSGSSSNLSFSASGSGSTGSDALPGDIGKDSKRRRFPETVTRNACRSCQKARSKCDGKEPCGRCLARDKSPACIYDAHIKQKKEEMLNAINDLNIKNQMKGQILEALKNEIEVPEILDRIGKGESYESIAGWLGHPPLERLGSFSPLETSFDMPLYGQTTTSPDSRWTAVTIDESVVGHLFELYFAWVHPVHTLFSKEHFLKCYKQQSDDFCSSILVNAICAMACHLHYEPLADRLRYEMLGDRFKEAAYANIDANRSSIITAQVFGVMFLVELAQSNAMRASSYINVAVDSLGKINVHGMEDFSLVWNVTYRGIQSLEIEWAQMTCRAPRVLKMPTIEMPSAREVAEDAAQWYAYRCHNDIGNSPTVPSLSATTNREKEKLVEIMRIITMMMYDSGAPSITAFACLQQYRRLVRWHDNLPFHLRYEDWKHDKVALPHILSLQLLYSNTVVHVLRPLLDFDDFRSSAVQDIVFTQAQRSMRLLEINLDMCPWRYLNTLQMFSVLHFCDALARFFPRPLGAKSKSGGQAVQVGLDILTDSAFPVAKTLQALLHSTAAECSVSLAGNAMRTDASMPVPRYSLNDMIDACARPTYKQPINEIHSKMVPSFSTDWDIESPAFHLQEHIGSYQVAQSPKSDEPGPRTLMHIRDLLNDP